MAAFGGGWLHDAVKRDTTYPCHRSTAQSKDMKRAAKHRSRHRGFDCDVLHWLTNDARDERFLDNIFAELCLRLQRAAFPSSGRRFISCSSIRNGSAPGSCGRRMREAELRELITMSGSDPNTSIVPPTKSTTVRPKCARISNAIPRWPQARRL